MWGILMSKIYINGGRKLNGEISIHGAKNSALPILAATLLCSGESILHNCPCLSDVDVSVKILKSLGCRCTRDGNTVTVDAGDVSGNEIPDNLMREMRSSIVFLGAIIGRTKSALVSSPGGCELGPRPIDIHIASLEQLGVQITEDHGYLKCSVPNNLKGAEINLSFPSVGATENIILAAALADGTTVIHNAAREPEISDLADFLNSAGAKIYGAGSDKIVINGVKKLNGAEHTVIPDRIVAATYIAAAAVTHGDILLRNIMPSHQVALLNVFRQCGCEISPYSNCLRIRSFTRPKRIPTIRTMVYPGFPTDAGPPVMAMMCVSNGTTVFVENIFQNRFKYIDELKRLGANIKTQGNVAIIEGCANLSGAATECTDLRGGAALVVAGLSAEGTTEIDKIFHIDRGYENIEKNLYALGADIKRE